MHNLHLSSLLRWAAGLGSSEAPAGHGHASAAKSVASMLR